MYSTEQKVKRYACYADVYFVPGETTTGFVASVADVHLSWDGSLYIETNVITLAGEFRHVMVATDGTIWIDGHMMNGGLLFEQIQLFKEHRHFRYAA